MSIQSSNFSLAKAEKFVKGIMEDAFPKGRVELVKDFFAPDVKMHFKDKIYDYDYIYNHFSVVKNNIENQHFKVTNVIVFDQFIAFSCQQNWVEKSDKSSHDALIFVIYRIHNKKVCEIWQILDTQADNAYELIKFSERMRPFKISEKDKQIFLRRLKTSTATKNIILSDIEQDCMYYYLNGFSAKETARAIAKYHALSPRTVEKYLASIKMRLNCGTKSQLRNKLFN